MLPVDGGGCQRKTPQKRCGKPLVRALGSGSGSVTDLGGMLPL